MSDKLARGQDIKREVLGDADVKRANRTITAEDKGFQDLITETTWGTVWASDAISRRERSMLTLALLAGLGEQEELEAHLRACHRTGTSKSDVMEVFQHVALTAGMPRANQAVKLAKSVWETHETDR
jgi:4-carboxymuconolactone decarboxylase